MLFSVIRFWHNGWIEDFYLDPQFHFTYYGLEWIRPLGLWTYGLFILNGIAALGVTLGFKYRWSTILFFLSFVYIEAMDKTTYLNHYYLVSCLAFMLLFIPAQRRWSLDVRSGNGRETVRRWAVLSLQLMLGIVYFYAGLAKLNTDWLVEANPLRIWLATRTHIPIVGPFLDFDWAPYALSWCGAIYDLSIVFLLLWRPTRFLAYTAVIIFHVLTAILFPIGVFPYVMILSTLIFFDTEDWRKIFRTLGLQRHLWKIKAIPHLDPTVKPSRWQWAPVIMTVFLGFQIVFPWRHQLYPGELFWHEEGYRFSWRVMLMEKAGYAQFKIVDTESGHAQYVDNTLFLTPFQEKQMATQPDFILEYAHFLAEEYTARGIAAPEVYVNAYVALNGRSSQPFIDPAINLLTQQDTWKHKDWILPFKDDIHGL